METLASRTGRSLPSPSRSEIESAEAREARRERAGFYSSRRWLAVQKIQLAEHPLCCWCGRLAAMVDHIVPRLQRPDLAYDQDNLRSCCRSCHSIHGEKNKAPGG